MTMTVKKRRSNHERASQARLSRTEISLRFEKLFLEHWSSVYGLAFIGDWIEQIGSFLHNSTAVYIGIVTSLIIPSETLWRRAAFEMQSPLSWVLGMSPFGTISVPSPVSIIYAILYILIALGLILYTFSRRDL